MFENRTNPPTARCKFKVEFGHQYFLSYVKHLFGKVKLILDHAYWCNIIIGMCSEVINIAISTDHTDITCVKIEPSVKIEYRTKSPITRLKVIKINFYS